MRRITWVASPGLVATTALTAGARTTPLACDGLRPCPRAVEPKGWRLSPIQAA